MQDKSRTGNALRRIPGKVRAASVPVVAVAVIAGVVSYGHIETLALSVHQPLDAARMLPGAVDFLVVAGSVILLAGSPLGWLGVVAGVAATVFANVESGLPYGPLAAIVAVWPAVAFSLATFMLERWLHVKKTPGAPVSPPSGSAGTGLPPAPDREEPRRVRSSRAAARPPVPAASVDEAALLAELSGILAAGKRPAFASWAREKTGNSRSLPAKRVYQKALAQMNGGSHGSD